MAEKNLTLTQVADMITTLGFMMSQEGNNLSKEDLAVIKNDLRNCVNAVEAAEQKENQDA